ncbi:hypothetical protein [Microbispora amethystogenes]|uniref:hypothetical protein n=1 Tax=Microbispora amethystogenes TaxID=1427754 RepID=UPI001953C168|nr:hypothetical protein [Microbispora amethystogenes]
MGAPDDPAGAGEDVAPVALGAGRRWCAVPPLPPAERPEVLCPEVLCPEVLCPEELRPEEL